MSVGGGVLDLLIRSSLLLALVWLAAAGVRKAGGSAAMRHMIWVVGLAGLLLFPLLSALMPPLPLPILPDVVPAPALTEAPAHAVTAAPPSAAPPAGSFGLGDFIQLLYLGVGAVLIGRLALGHWLLARL
jgi:hypothetical protein